MKNIFSLLSLFLSGLLLALAHPFYYEDFSIDNAPLNFLFGTLGLLLFIPISLRPETAKKRFLFGFFGGLGYFSGVFYWVSYALEHYGSIHRIVAWLVVFLLAAYLGLFMGTWSAIAGRTDIKDKSPLLKILAWASLWASIEALRQWIFTGLSWGELGFTFSTVPWLARTSSVWGVHGLTFLWIGFVGLLLHLKFILDRSLAPRNFLIVVGIVIALAVFANLSFPREGGLKLNIGLVQPNILQEMKWDSAKAEDHLNVLQELSNQAILKNADLVIWPETSLPYSLIAAQRELPFTSSKPVIFGAVVRERVINRNSAVLMQGNQILQRFDKIHLVPFGEYVPFKEYLSFGKLVQNAGDFLPGGHSQELLSLPGTQVKIGPLICYEDIFSRSSVAHAKKGAQLLVNLTNDAWYGPTSAQHQHAAIAAMQVYQTGIPMVRSTNNGLTTFITPFHRWDEPSFVRGVSVRELSLWESPPPPQTFFVWTYPLMEWIFPILFVIALLWKDRPRTKRIFFQKSKSY